MAGNGTIMLGFSASSSNIFPSIGVTGRLSSDPLGTMRAGLKVFEGTGAQVSSFNRWGDYSMMAVDPVDDSTFWYTQEYYATTGSFDFKTRIISILVGGAQASVGAEGFGTEWGVAPSAVPIEIGDVPTETSLLGNHPNPFNPETWISYQLTNQAHVSIQIYDVQGRLIRTLDLGYQPPGVYLDRSRAAHWDGRNQKGEIVPGGTYFYTFKADEFQATRKMVIVK